MKCRWVLCLISLFFFVLPADAYRYALLIGQNDGGAEVEPLKYAQLDARKFADILIQLADFAPDNVINLYDTDSTHLQQQIDTIASRLNADPRHDDALFLLYYSGHADGQSLLLGKTRYPLALIESQMSKLPAGIRIGIFDACQSGAITSFKGGRRAEPFYLKSQQDIKGQVIIASAAAQERAQESSSLKGVCVLVSLVQWIAGECGCFAR